MRQQRAATRGAPAAPLLHAAAPCHAAWRTPNDGPNPGGTPRPAVGVAAPRGVSSQGDSGDEPAGEVADGEAKEGVSPGADDPLGLPPRGLHALVPIGPKPKKPGGAGRVAKEGGGGAAAGGGGGGGGRRSDAMP